MTSSQAILTLDIEPVWSGHPVDFCLLTTETEQYVAYYDQHRQMTIAKRSLESQSWQYHKMRSAQPDMPAYMAAQTSTVLGWDSHNDIVMMMDAAGHLHLSGNMHCNALTYFRTQKPGDITTFEQHFSMTGQLEDRCTYPHFLVGEQGDLIFHYRHGSSGNGLEIYNVYDHKMQTWRRLLDQPLTDGQDQMNAYLHEPYLGPDNSFHLSWVWRDTPDCKTNHDLSYARSRNLVDWFTADGRPIVLPMTLQTEGVIVDPVPAEGGIINGSGKIGFDHQHRPILTYHKFDAAGHTQAYNARLEDGKWIVYQTSDWDYRWFFEGGGSISNDVILGAVELDESGQLWLQYDHVKEGSGVWRLDECTLKPLETVSITSPYPDRLTQCESDFPNMKVRWGNDVGLNPNSKTTYYLRWETLPPNRDQPRTDPLPEPSMLRLYEIAK